jgi:aspartate ammonia-lyase
MKLNKTIKDVLLEKRLLSEEEIDNLLDITKLI